MPARRRPNVGGRVEGVGGALPEEEAARVMRAYLMGELDEDDARRFYEDYEEEIVSRMMRSPEGLSRWAGAIVSASDAAHHKAAQERLEAAKAWQRRVLSETAEERATNPD